MYRTPEGGDQAEATGTIDEQANGQYKFTFSQDDTNTDTAGFLFAASGAISQNFNLVFQTVGAAGSGSYTDSLTYYGSIDEANTYFSTRLNSSPWTESSDATKVAALTTATQIIDRLNFAGEKADSDQNLQFPRRCVVPDGDDLIDDSVPQDIRFANFEIALKLLDGIDPDYELQNLQMTQAMYGSVQTQYNRNFAPDYVLAGVPSPRAWAYLKPYLRDPYEITLERVN